MFFFVGGIQPKTVTVDDTPRMCPVCGLAQARLKRVDHYLSLFFIPVFPVKRGEPVLICDRCGAMSSASEGGRGEALRPISVDNTCPRCGNTVDPSFNYCPQCGSRI